MIAPRYRFRLDRQGHDPIAIGRGGSEAALAAVSVAGVFSLALTALSRRTLSAILLTYVPSILLPLPRHLDIALREEPPEYMETQ